MTKQDIKSLLDAKSEAMLSWLESQPADTFSKQKTEGKWSNGQHLDHLRISTRAVNKGFKIPGLILRYKFGTNNRQEKSYEQLVHKYETKLKHAGFKAPKAFQPKTVTENDKERIVQWFGQEITTMKNWVDKMSDKKMSKLILPHPALGKMTLREFVYFTALHTEHHFNLMKQYNDWRDG